MFQKVIGQKPGDTSPSPSTQTTAPTANSGQQPAASAAAPSPSLTAPARPPSAASRNVLSTDVEVKGTLKFTNDLIVDGRIEGDIQSVTVHGKVHGNITATDRVDLKAGAEVVGDIKAKILTMEPGAIFVGKSTIGTPTANPSTNSDGANAAAKSEQTKKP